MNERTVVFIATISFLNDNTAAYSRIINYSSALVENNINVYLYSFENVFDKTDNVVEIKKGINLFKKKYSGFFYYINAFRSLIKLRNRFRNKNIVYVFYPSSKFLADIIVLSVFKLFSKNNVLFCEINELRKAYVFNRFFPNNLLFIFSSLKNLIDFIFYSILEKTSGLYDGLLVISSNLDTYFSKYNKKRIIIPILVNVPIVRDVKLITADYFEIGFFGSLVLKKEGLLNCFKAIKKLNDNLIKVRLNLYGMASKKELNFINKWINSKNLKSIIIYRGIISHKEVSSEMKKMNLLILTRPKNKQNHYGFSTKLGEYLASGVPSLITNVSDNKSYIKDGVNGYLVDDIDVELLYNKLRIIIKNYDNDKLRISINAFNTVNLHFNYKKYSQILNNFLFNEI